MALVEVPDSVTIAELRRDGYVLLTLRTAPEDTGKIIGKGGRVARSLRTVLNGAGRKLKMRVDLSIVDEGERCVPGERR